VTLTGVLVEDQDSWERPVTVRHGEERGDRVVAGDEVDQLAGEAIFLHGRQHLDSRSCGHGVNTQEGPKLFPKSAGVLQSSAHGLILTQRHATCAEFRTSCHRPIPPATQR
jgi:hypothetical protein